VGVVAGTSRTYRTYRTATVTRGYLHRLSPARFLLHTGVRRRRWRTRDRPDRVRGYFFTRPRATGGAWGRRRYWARTPCPWDTSRTPSSYCHRTLPDLLRLGRLVPERMISVQQEHEGLCSRKRVSAWRVADGAYIHNVRYVWGEWVESGLTVSRGSSAAVSIKWNVLWKRRARGVL